MSAWPRYPLLYEINTWTWLEGLSRGARVPARLDTVPRDELARLADLGFDGIWLMGIWQRSPAGRDIARRHFGLRQEFARALPGFKESDIVGSPYAVFDYVVEPAFGGNDALAAFRQRLRDFGLQLVLDFVPNHLAVDHPWVSQRPERFVRGEPDILKARPGEYFRAEGAVLAHGRDPFSQPWTDTVQLDYRRRETRLAMQEFLVRLAGLCDGVRCDMAMLVLRHIFERTWGGAFDRREEFWPEAIARVKAVFPDFLMLAEAYWETESVLQEQGFDYVYDKRLYDRLTGRDPEPVQDHVRLADLSYQSGLLRFLENHDEERLAALLERNRGEASAVAAFTLPGARLVHHGQMHGALRRVPVQLGRSPVESRDEALEGFYRRLLACLCRPAFHEGSWRSLDPRPVQHGSSSHLAFLAGLWEWSDERWLAVVNLSPERGSCRLSINRSWVTGGSWLLEDWLHDAAYVRQGRELADSGLQVELPGYGYHLLKLLPRQG